MHNCKCQRPGRRKEMELNSQLDFSDGFILFLATVVSILFFILYIKMRYDSVTPKISDKFKKCESPGCIRCSMYEKVLTLATDRLENIYGPNIYCPEKSLKTFKKTNNYCREKDSGYSDYQRIHASLGQKLSLDTSQKPEVFGLYGLTAMPWWTPSRDVVSDVQELETNFKEILKEFWKVHSESTAVWRVNNTPNGQWKVFHLVNQGKIQNKNIDLCPNTFKLITSLPSMMIKNVFGNVAFSVIDPGTVITEHYGPTNIRLRCHLGLVTPVCCHLCVAGVKCHWGRGQCLVFDDSFLHSVEHSGTEQDGWRAVLMVDLWHPGITPTERAVIDTIFKPD